MRLSVTVGLLTCLQVASIPTVVSSDEVEFTELTSSFVFSCFRQAPDFKASRKAFQQMEFTRRTGDPDVFENSFSQLGGTGPFTSTSGTPPNTGCFVYTNDIDHQAAAKQMNEAVFLMNGGDVQPDIRGKDAYWTFQGSASTQLIAIVSPKSEGKYKGRTLMALMPLN